MLSVGIIIGVGTYIISTFFEFIIASKGIGVYGGIFYYAAAFLSVILWGLSYWLIPNKKWLFYIG